MTTQITITLPDETYLRAQRFARLANRDIASVLADTVIGALPAMSQQIDHLEAIATLTDEQILALTELQMEPEQDQRLSTLLSEQQSRTLATAELEELEGSIPLVHFSFKALILRVLCTRKISALPPIFVSGGGLCPRHSQKWDAPN
jgi:predicted DNA-binding protein